MRPGRLDRILFVGPPDKAGREEILRIRIKTMTVGPDVDIANIAELVSLLIHSKPIYLIAVAFIE
jgi:AAA family ATPase